MKKPQRMKSSITGKKTIYSNSQTKQSWMLGNFESFTVRRHPIPLYPCRHARNLISLTRAATAHSHETVENTVLSTPYLVLASRPGSHPTHNYLNLNPLPGPSGKRSWSFSQTPHLRPPTLRLPSGGRANQPLIPPRPPHPWEALGRTARPREWR